jgi:ATP-dependent protease Clp ATPase subunit
MIKVSDIFEDPDNVCQSEYRAICEVAIESVLQTDAYEAISEEAELNIQEAQHLKSVLEELRDISAELVEDVVMRIEKERLRN